MHLKILVDKKKGNFAYHTVTAAPPDGGLGYKKLQSGCRPLCNFFPPHFCCCWKTSFSFIATAKTSVTLNVKCHCVIDYELNILKIIEHIL